MAGPAIFRKSALERLSTPEQLDQVISVTNSRSWLGLLVLGLLITLAILWSWFGTIPKKVEGQGILLKPGGVQIVVATVPGTLAELRVHAGSRVEKGQPVAVMEERVQPLAPMVREEISCPYSGRVLEVLANPGATIAAGSSLFVVEPETDGLEAIVYVPAGQGKKIHAGMPVQISPSTVKREEYGYMLGEVVEVSDLAVSREGMLRSIGNDTVVDGLLKAGPVLLIKVAIKKSAETPTGFAWSSSRGPKLQLTSGTPCSTQFIVERKRPISMVIPKLRELTGIF